VNPPGWDDIVLVHLGRGRDHAESLGSLQERVGAPRRAIEAAVQSLRLRGLPVASGAEGVWLGDAADVEATLRSLRGRMRSQYQTMLALRKTLRQMRKSDVEQTTLFGEAA